MTTEPQPPVDEPVAAPDPQPDPPARAVRRPSSGLVLALVGAFLLGGLVFGGLGVAAGLMVGHHSGHGDGFRHDRGGWGERRGDVRDRAMKERMLRERGLPGGMRERLRQRGLPDQPLPWPLPGDRLPGQPVPRLPLPGAPLPDGSGLPVPPPVAPTATP